MKSSLPFQTLRAHASRWRLWASCFVLMFSLATVITSDAQRYDLLHRFVKGDGFGPTSLVQGADGNFYGVGLTSGYNNGGNVFKLTPSGTLTSLYMFCPQGQPLCLDGKRPNGLVLASDGNLYGTTGFGGVGGRGTIFRVTPAGAFSTIYNFGVGLDGATPVGELIQGSDGALYGATFHGGIHDGGTVFKITFDGVFTSIHSFCSQSPNCSDGTNPTAGVLQASNGALYGTTSRGGTGPACTFSEGCGTLFRISSGGQFTTLYNFCQQPNCGDGMFPQTGLIQATDGKIYGITNAGGPPDGLCTAGCGVAFRIALSGAGFSALHVLSQSEGSQFQNLIQATDGSFYGTAQTGGSSGLGTLFKMDSAGTVTVLLNFCNDASCRYTFNPSGVMQATNGLFYGTTLGISNGAVFTYGFPPFVRISPASGPVGTVVRIYGTDLSGATGVTFGAVPATFTILSANEITASVPSGAGYGSVRVATPTGILLSDVVFVTK